MTEIRKLNKNDLSPLIGLEVHPAQSDFVAPNAITMAQSIFEAGSEIYGLWDGDAAVGLIAVIDMSHPDADLDEGDDPDGLYIWRLMVAADRQGQGHGAAAMAFAAERCAELGRARIVLSAVDEKGTAIPFYEKIGYERTGRIISGEVEMALKQG